MGDVFFCITLSVLVVRYWWKHQHFEFGGEKPKRSIFDNLSGQKRVPKQVKTEEEKQHEKDIADLRRQGYTDELIAVILPTINNGQ